MHPSRAAWKSSLILFCVMAFHPPERKAFIFQYISTSCGDIIVSQDIFQRENFHILIQNENFAEKTFVDCSGPIFMRVQPQNFAEKTFVCRCNHKILQRKLLWIALVQFLCRCNHKILQRKLLWIALVQFLCRCNHKILQRKLSWMVLELLWIALVQFLCRCNHKILQRKSFLPGKCSGPIFMQVQPQNFAEKTFVDCSGPIFMQVQPQNFAEKTFMDGFGRKTESFLPGKCYAIQYFRRAISLREVFRTC